MKLLIKLILKFILQAGPSSSIYLKRELLTKKEFGEFKNHPRISNFLSSTDFFLGQYIYDKKINFIYNPKTDIGNLLYKTGKFEDSEITYSSNLLAQYEPGTIIDVGANIGLHVISWAKKVNKHTFYAFEPTKTVCGILSESVKRNKLEKKISIIQKAVSNKNGVAKFYETSDDAYNSLKDTKRKDVNNIYDVSVISIDDFISQYKITDLRFIKIDTEGFEDEVIEGAQNTIIKYMPDFFIEIYKGTNSNAYPERTIDRMIHHGYNAYVFKDGKVHPYLSHDDRFYNYFFSKRVLII